GSRRLAMEPELARQPGLLFLDAPTDPLDVEGIRWRERLLSSASFASVVVSHDRYFLDTVVNDVAEISRSYPEGIFRVEGGYSKFLEKKEEFLLAQSNRQESLANRVRREVEWLRRGPKARTGKSKARRTRGTWSAPPGCASSTSTRPASSSIGRGRCAKGWARTAIT